jgi:hypothetical protein
MEVPEEKAFRNPVCIMSENLGTKDPKEDVYGEGKQLNAGTGKRSCRRWYLRFFLTWKYCQAHYRKDDLCRKSPFLKSRDRPFHRNLL